MDIQLGMVYSLAIAILPCLLCGFRAKYERAHHARGTPSTVDEAQGVLGNLALSSPAHDLAGRLDHVSKTTCPTHWLATGNLATISIDREASFVGRIHRIKEGTDLSLLAESGIFEAHGREDGISIVDFGKLDVPWPIPCHLKGLTRRDDNGRGGHPWTLPDGIVVGGTRPGAQEIHGRLRKRLGPLRRRDYASRRAATGHDAFQQVQGIVYHPRIEDVINGDGLPLEHRIGIEQRVEVLVDRHLGELCLGCTELVHMAPLH